MQLVDVPSMILVNGAMRKHICTRILLGCSPGYRLDWQPGQLREQRFWSLGAERKRLHLRCAATC